MSRKRYYYDPETRSFSERPPVGPREGHYVISDEIDPTWHPVADVMVTSRSKFEHLNRLHGVVNRSGETITPKAPCPRKMQEQRIESIRAAMGELGFGD